MCTSRPTAARYTWTPQASPCSSAVGAKTKAMRPLKKLWPPPCWPPAAGMRTRLCTTHAVAVAPSPLKLHKLRAVLRLVFCDVLGLKNYYPSNHTCGKPFKKMRAHKSTSPLQKFTPLMWLSAWLTSRSATQSALALAKWYKRAVVMHFSACHRAKHPASCCSTRRTASALLQRV